jgi:multiple sugar transport system permease protein
MTVPSVSRPVTTAEPVAEVKRNTAQIVLNTIFRYAIYIVLTLLFVFPIVFMSMSSFKPHDQIFADMRSFRAFLPVGDISLNNYQDVFTNSKFPRFVLNSVGMAGVQIVLGMFINSLAAYALSRLKWRGQRVVLTVIIATMIIPFETIAIPLLLLVTQLPSLSFEQGVALTTGWLNTYQVQVIPFLAGAYSIFLFYQFFQDIPRELDEAALIDGANRFQIYRHVILPLSGPVFATVAILTFQSAWNSFLWPIMTVQSEDIRPVMVGMQYFFQQEPRWGTIMAYATLVTLPVLLLFLIFQGAFVKSVASTGIKG